MNSTQPQRHGTRLDDNVRNVCKWLVQVQRLARHIINHFTRQPLDWYKTRTN